MREITQKQTYVLRYIHDFIGGHGYPPVIREIGQEFNIRSLRGVTVHLDALERKGYLTRQPTPRSIRLTRLGLRELGVESPAAAIISRLHAVRDEHFQEAARQDPSGPNSIKRMRYTAGVLQALAEEFAARHLPENRT